MIEDQPTIVAIDHVQLAMPRGQEEAARRFYRDVLGISERKKPENLVKRGGCWFEDSSVRIHLGVEDDFRPARKAHLAIQVAGLAKLKLRLERHGIETLTDESFEDCDRFYVDDPFGNRIEFLEPR